MTTVAVAPVDRSVQSPVARGLRAIVRWAAARRVAHARSEALNSLLFAPEHRLRDVGITREELIRAIEARGGSVKRQEFWY
jgi:uncharacterized protein YjiS (DUF1127 family)